MFFFVKKKDKFLSKCWEKLNTAYYFKNDYISLTRDVTDLDDLNC